MKAGTKVMVQGWNIAGLPVTENATVARVTKEMIPMPANYVPVRFADGRKLLIPSEHVQVGYFDRYATA
jgi:hypothetical protein